LGAWRAVQKKVRLNENDSKSRKGSFMSTDARCLLEVAGNKIHADTAKTIVEAVFGVCEPSYRKSLTQGRGSPPLAVVQFTCVDGPPTTLVAELSARLTDLTFRLVCAGPVGGPGTGVTYKAGAIISEDDEVDFSKEVPSDAGYRNDAYAPPDNRVSLRTIGEIAKRRLDQAYSLLYEEIPADSDHSWDDQMTKRMYFDQYGLLKSLVGAEDEEHLTRREQQHKARARRLSARSKAHDRLKTALEWLADPEVAPLLDADDRDVLTRAATMLEKVKPDFRGELATTVE
jgi:hypothetical protein